MNNINTEFVFPSIIKGISHNIIEKLYFKTNNSRPSDLVLTITVKILSFRVTEFEFSKDKYI